MIQNKRLACLKIVEEKLINMFSTPIIIRKINSVNYKGYVHKLKKELNNGDRSHTEAIHDSHKFKRQEKPQETIAETVKLMSKKKQKKQESKSHNSKQTIN